MKITIIQPDTIWEDKTANLRKIEGIIEDHPGKTDVIVLPEMFSTGFTLNAAQLAEDMNGGTMSWMSDLSAEGNFAVCGSSIIRAEGRYYNHFSFLAQQNISFSYDKRHLFSLGGENKIFTPGGSRVTFVYGEFRFLPVICYDLRFPVWIRNRGDYDILICVASWPDVRREAWNSLLKARAIENQCFVIGVNNTGRDKEGYTYAGDSVVLDPLGKVMGKVNEYEEGSATVELSLEYLQDIRKKLPFLDDADDFSLNLSG